MQNCQFVKLANVKDQLEELLAQSIKLYADGYRDFYGSWPLLPTYIKLCAQMKAFTPKEYTSEESCYFANHKGQCRGWHCDKPTNMIIAAYPYPTDILISDDGNIQLDAICNHEINNIYVAQKLASGAARVFTPEVGDMYLLTGPVIHQASEKGMDEPHLCMRLHLKSIPPVDKIKALNDAYDYFDLKDKVNVYSNS